MNIKDSLRTNYREFSVIVDINMLSVMCKVMEKIV